MKALRRQVCVYGVRVCVGEEVRDVFFLISICTYIHSHISAYTHTHKTTTEEEIMAVLERDRLEYEEANRFRLGERWQDEDDD